MEDSKGFAKIWSEAHRQRSEYVWSLILKLMAAPRLASGLAGKLASEQPSNVPDEDAPLAPLSPSDVATEIARQLRDPAGHAVLTPHNFDQNHCPRRS